MSHIFISYSTKNAAYAYRLADKLRDEGFDVWIDNDELRSADNWWESIVRALRASSTFVVVMTPAARESRWVQREVTLADNWGKPSFPLLLEGENFEIYVLTQFHSVKDGSLPKPKFYDDLARHTKREKHKGQVVTEESSAQAPNDAAVKAALLNVPRAEPPQPAPVGKASMPSVGNKTKALLPAPFDWCEIPAGKVTLEKGGYLKEATTFDVPAFLMAKYPVTNAQYELFIKDGGYENKQWWTDAGWQVKQKRNWIEPRYWKDSNFNGKNQPIVCVSWYEALAFCQWLSSKTGEKILLPTEQEWQRAAQGNDRREYPWGNDFDKSKTNTKESNIGKTTSVMDYPNGASPYGVLDMAGNAFEWCLTKGLEDRTNVIDDTNWPRILRGGSFCFDSDFAWNTYNRSVNPDMDTRYDYGFRICAAH